MTVRDGAAGAVAAVGNPASAFAAGAWSYIVFGIGLTVLGPTLQPIRETFNLGIAELGLIFLFSSLGYVLASVTASPASDRRGRRPFALAGTAGIALGFAMVAAAPSWPLLLAGAFVSGVGMGLLDGPLNALIMDLAPTRSATLLNFLHLFFGAGALLGPIGAGLAIGQGVGWRTIFWTVAALSATAILPFLLLRSPPRPAAAPSLPWREIVRVALRPIALAMMVVLVFYVGAEVAYGGWMPSYLELELRMPRGLAATSVTVFWAGILVGRLLTGLLARRVDPLGLLTLSLAAAAGVGLVAALTDNPAAALAGFGLVGILISGALPTALATGVSGYGWMAGALLGYMAASAGAGGILLPPFAGALADALGLRAAMLAAAGMSAIAAGASLWGMLLARRTRGARP